MKHTKDIDLKFQLTLQVGFLAEESRSVIRIIVVFCHHENVKQCAAMFVGPKLGGNVEKKVTLNAHAARMGRCSPVRLCFS